MSEIKVSVIIPVYNASRWLAESLNTVLSQTLEEIEIICVDDGSSDGSAQILKAFQKKDNRIKILSQENAGAGAARNKGLDAASGEYLSFLDADDEFEPEMLQKAYFSITDGDADICIFRWGMIDQEGLRFGNSGYEQYLIPNKKVFSPDDIQDDLFGITNPAAWNKLYKRDYIQKNGIRFQEIKSINDLYFTYFSLIQANRVVVLEDVLLHYRPGNAGSASNSRDSNGHCLYEAFSELKDEVDRNFPERRKDFLNLVVRNILFVADSISDRNAFESFIEDVRGKWLANLTQEFDKKSSYYILLEYERIHAMISKSVEDYIFYELKRTKKEEALLQKEKLILENEQQSLTKSYYEISSLKSHIGFYARKQIKKLRKNQDDEKTSRHAYIHKKNTIDIYGPMEKGEEAKQWGDYYFALSLKKEFEKRGYTANIKYYPEEPGDSDSEYALILRGIRKNYPEGLKAQKIIMWNISHPGEVSTDEYNRCGLVYIASTRYAKELQETVSVPVKPLLQCTDEEMMRFAEEGKKHELLFIGNTRNVYRQIIKDLLPTDYDLKIYGLGWEKFIAHENISGEYFDYDKIAQAYHDAKIVLNDHWDDMREYGFVSNRIFDVLASESFVISDDMAEIHELFGDCVETYSTKDELKEKIDYYMNHQEEREAKARSGREIVLENHTFGKRVDEIVRDMGDKNIWKNDAF